MGTTRSCAFDLLRERVDAHPVVAVHGDEAALEPEQARGFLDGEVRVLGRQDVAPGPQLARGCKSDDGRCRGGVVDVAVQSLG